MKLLKMATTIVIVLTLSACDFLSPSVESMGEEIVKQYQKSPDSFKSEFSEIIWKGREKGGKDVYVVRVSYDSQNSFGAMLRGCAFVAFTVVGREYQWRREAGFQEQEDARFCMKSLPEPAHQALADVARAYAAMSFDLVTDSEIAAQ